MQEILRKHPKLKWRGVTTWPPQLGGVVDRERFPQADETILADVTVHDQDFAGPRRVGVTVDYAGRKHSGQVFADDSEVIAKLYGFLRAHIGDPLSKIENEIVDL